MNVLIAAQLDRKRVDGVAPCARARIEGPHRRPVGHPADAEPDRAGLVHRRCDGDDGEVAVTARDLAKGAAPISGPGRETHRDVQRKQVDYTNRNRTILEAV